MNKTLENILKRFQLANDFILKSIYDNKILLTNKVFSNSFDLEFYFQNILNDYDHNELYSFQRIYLTNFINSLKENISITDIYIDIIEDNYFYIEISVSNFGEILPVFHINPYLKEIYLVDNFQIQSINEELIQIENENIEILNRIELLNMSKSNPLLITGDNSIKMMDRLIRKNKYRQEDEKELNYLFVCLNENDFKISNLKTQIEEIQNNLIQAFYLRDKYMERLINTYNFKVINYISNSHVKIKKLSEIDKSLFSYDISSS